MNYNADILKTIKPLTKRKPKCSATRLVITKHLSQRYSHANWKSSSKWSLKCFKRILKSLHSNDLLFFSNLSVKFAIFWKSSLLSNSFYCLFVYKQKLMPQQLQHYNRYKCENSSVCYLCWSDHIFVIISYIMSYITGKNFSQYL